MDKIIFWNPDPAIFTIGGAFPVRYYSLLFVGGLFLGFWVVYKAYQREGLSVERLNQLALYIFIGTILGARLGHCLFYEPDYYLSRPLEMLLPFRIDQGQFIFTGFQGLASHGGGIGVFLAILLFVRRTGADFFLIVDKIVLATPLTAAFIRLGNFMNSEIIGHPTNGDYGVVFLRIDNLPRHPAQLYEAIAYLLIFVLLNTLYRKGVFQKSNGILAGLFLVLIFAARFVIEFFKINQVNFENEMTLNMGQLLSIPFVLVGLGLMWWRSKVPIQK